MRHKIFVSYKYNDKSVDYLPNYYKGTPRDYVDYLQDHKYSGDHINKAENDDEDLSQFKDDTIRSKLKEKIWDSSITIILISPQMVDAGVSEKDQWIPWEVSYSLRTQMRGKKRSHSNAMLGIVLPDIYGSYEYFIHDKKLEGIDVKEIRSHKTFSIIRDNMFNQKEPTIKYLVNEKVYYGDCSYIPVLKWNDFITNPNRYFERAINIMNNEDEYIIHKKINEG